MYLVFQLVWRIIHVQPLHYQIAFSRLQTGAHMYVGKDCGFVGREGCIHKQLYVHTDIDCVQHFFHMCMWAETCVLQHCTFQLRAACHVRPEFSKTLPARAHELCKNIWELVPHN